MIDFIGTYTFPYHWGWEADGKSYEARGMDLTQIGNTPGGLLALERFVDWSANKDAMSIARGKIAEALRIPAVSAALKEAHAKDMKKGLKKWKKRSVKIPRCEHNSLFGY